MGVFILFSPALNQEKLQFSDIFHEGYRYNTFHAACELFGFKYFPGNNYAPNPTIEPPQSLIDYLFHVLEEVNLNVTTPLLMHIFTPHFFIYLFLFLFWFIYFLGLGGPSKPLGPRKFVASTG